MHDGGPYHIETSSLICSENQWTDFYMIMTSVMKESTENDLVHYEFTSEVYACMYILFIWNVSKSYKKPRKESSFFLKETLLEGVLTDSFSPGSLTPSRVFLTVSRLFENLISIQLINKINNLILSSYFCVYQRHLTFKI